MTSPESPDTRPTFDQLIEAAEQGPVLDGATMDRLGETALGIYQLAFLRSPRELRGPLPVGEPDSSDES